MRDIILAGIQGCGKGTQAQKLLEKYPDDFSYFETGNILRALMSNDNSIGNYLRDTVNSGALVADDVIISLFGVFLETLGEKGVLSDGNLRRLWQTKGIMQALKNKSRNPVVIWLEIPEEETKKRLQTRKMCTSCGHIYSTQLDGNIANCLACGGELYQRADDLDEKAVATRIAAYHEETVPALEYVEKNFDLVRIDGMQSIADIFSQIEKILEK